MRKIWMGMGKNESVRSAAFALLRRPVDYDEQPPRLHVVRPSSGPMQILKTRSNKKTVFVSKLNKSRSWIAA